MKTALVPLLILLLSACGGGGGSSSSGASAPPATPPPAVRKDLLYGYYAVDGNQITETSNHVNVVMVPDFGDWSTPAGRDAIAQLQIQRMQEARARGIDKFILMVGFLTFTPQYEFKGSADLQAYEYQLMALDLKRSVVALYPLDEPDMLGVSGATMALAYNTIRVTWPDAKIMVIYGDHATPGRDAADWVGIDEYGKGEGVLRDLPAISAQQNWVLVPGGSNPWRNDPAPFEAFADTHPQVVAIVPFVWFDRTDEQGVQQAGIRSNGMSPKYCSLGARIRGIPPNC